MNIARTFSEFINKSVSKYSDYKALRFIGEDSVTYRELGENIDGLIAFLEKIGITQGNKVAILSQNMPNWVIAYLSLQKMGVITIPVLPDFSQTEIENVLLHSEADAIFVSTELQSKLNTTEIPSIKHVINLNSFELNKTVKNVTYNSGDKPAKSYSVDPEELAVLLYTSGTTGSSKGVMLSQKNILTNVWQSAQIQEIVPGDRFLSILPLSHTYENTIGMLLPLFKGAEVNYLKKAPTPAVLLPALKEVRPTLMLSVPLIIEKIFRARILPEIDKKAITRFLYKFRPTQKLLHRVAGKKLYRTFGGELKFFGIGGAKLDGKVEQFLRDARFPYAIGYGLTETAPLLAGSNPSETKFQAIGKVVKNCEIKLHKVDGISGEGEIWAKGPNLMLGYYKNEELTREVITEDGWFKTGDLGHFDKQGALSHRGRLKNVIVGANGENIYPEEIESVINNYRHVLESIVVQQKGKLVAMVHFNREELEQRVKTMYSNLSNQLDDKFQEISRKVDELVEDLSKELQQHINSRVNKFSRIHSLIIHHEPFQKTATRKIKRYLYA